MRILLSLLLMILSPQLLACAMGFGFHFTPDLPAGYVRSAGEGEAITAFLDREYGPGKWEYAPAQLRVKAPDIAENSAIVPVTVGSDDAGMAGRYRRVRVLLEKQVDVLDASRFSPEYLPPVYHVDGEDWQTRNHPKALQLHEITHKASAIGPVSEFALSDRAIPDFSLRLNLQGVNGARMFAVFIPADGSRLVQVARQEGVIQVYPRCTRTIYVDGEWPAGLKSAYDYQ